MLCPAIVDGGMVLDFVKTGLGPAVVGGSTPRVSSSQVLLVHLCD